MVGARETLALLATSGELVREHLLTDLVPFNEAPALFADLSERRRHAVSAVLQAAPV